jgi:alpha-glucosidase
MIRVQASKFESFESNPYSVIVQPKAVDFELEELGNQLILKTALLRV